MLISKTQRQKLRYVKVTDSALDLGRFPDFLIVGPQRTGTTWLHANLREHPEIFLAEPKELFFFSRLKTPDHLRFQSDDLGWYLAFFRDPLWRLVLKNLLCLRRHRRFYRPRIRGEATASYAALDRDVIAEIALLNPDLKVILMIRDPIERAWSHATKDLVRNRGRRFEEVSDAEWQAFFRDPYQLRCARYVENYDNWASCFPKGNIFVGAFDDIAARPAAFMGKVLRFLGVASQERYFGSLVHEAVNPAGSARIPDKHRRYLETVLARELEALHARFGTSAGRAD